MAPLTELGEKNLELEMAELGYIALSIILIVLLIASSEAVTMPFIQAMTSALATIPFTGGPMSTGLIGAKLGIGTKLLYYLGYFGRSAVPKTPAKAAPKPAPKSVPQLPAGLQALPLPYALAGAGGLQQVRGSGGFGGPQSYQMPFGGPDPYQLFQALRAQGYDANTAMQILNYGGFGMNTGPVFPMNAGAGGFAPNSAGLGGGFPQGGGGFPEGFPSNPSPPSFQGTGGSIAEQPSTIQHQSVNEGEGSDDIESFFTFLKDMDENGCISRLMCDIGQDPSFLGEFSENINGIVSSLDVQPSSGAYPYIQILENGRNEGGCDTKFLQCPDSAYEVVKSVAPSVGVPQHLNSAAVNDL
ncbi:uncharacterized protein TNCT_699491 [Trichonephila clavata]|uniref:Uncharacterized protein n=1 Tax=Trichonephila clavata TaxID=2740835 RepID=A0A8X6HTQ1_TRICU|nr:uncharacterized protein TNCT_699491 [Trichonephila clavata]